MVHKCRWYNGVKIRDITVRDRKTIHCAKCRQQLSKDEIDEKMLEEIKKQYPKIRV